MVLRQTQDLTPDEHPVTYQQTHPIAITFSCMHTHTHTQTQDLMPYEHLVTHQQTTSRL